MLRDRPDDLVLDRNVLVHELVSEPHDLAGVRDPFCQVRGLPRHGVHGLADDRELALHRRTDRAVGKVRLHVHTAQDHNDGVARIDDVPQMGNHATVASRIVCTFVRSRW